MNYSNRNTTDDMKNKQNYKIWRGCIIFLLAWIFITLNPCIVMGSDSTTEERPNILFILIDDLGWPTLGCYGNEHVPTPSLDCLANEGMRFTNAYVMSLCTPSRASLLTGQYVERTGLWHVIGGWYGYPWAIVEEPLFSTNLSRDHFTIAKGLKAAGYRTGLFGKWHVNMQPDIDRVGIHSLKPSAGKYYGFDHVEPPIPRDMLGADGEDKGVDALTDQVISFIGQSAEKPFFVYLSHFTIHGKVVAPNELVKKYLKKGYPAKGKFNATYLAAIEHLDHSVGRLMVSLERMNLHENTVVIFLSDNGGIHERWDAYTLREQIPSPDYLTVDLSEFDNFPLRAGKGSVYEGGIRVPCIVRWPGHILAGSVNDTPIHIVDWLPTLLGIAGQSPPEGYANDGVDLTPLLKGEAIPARTLYWYLPFYDMRWGITPSAIIRDGKYKLIVFFGDRIDAEGLYIPGPYLELFNLQDDIGETRNLSAEKPGIAAQMRHKLYDHMKVIGVDIPGPNPIYNPQRKLMEGTTRNMPDYIKKRW
jgi:uncharacterized sulfatase